jgi:hypothetical protein
MTTAYDTVTALSVSSFSEATSTDNPTPGGGAVAGVVAGLAAALAGMAGRFAVKRDVGGAAKGALVGRADDLRKRCCELADADSYVYATFEASAILVNVNVNVNGDAGDTRLTQANAVAASRDARQAAAMFGFLDDAVIR